MSTLRTRIAGFRVDIVQVPSDAEGPGRNFEATICPQFSERETPRQLRGSYESGSLWSVLAPVTATIADFAYYNPDLYNANEFQMERLYAAIDYIGPIIDRTTH